MAAARPVIVSGQVVGPPDRTRTFRIHDAGSLEAIRSTAQTNGLPVDRITEVSVRDPYFYRV